MRKYYQIEYNFLFFLFAYSCILLPYLILVFLGFGLQSYIHIIYAILTTVYFACLYSLRKRIFMKVSIHREGVKFHYFREIKYILLWSDIVDFSLITRGSVLYMKLGVHVDKQDRESGVFQQDGSILIMCFRYTLRKDIIRYCDNSIVTEKLKRFKLSPISFFRKEPE